MSDDRPLGSLAEAMSVVKLSASPNLSCAYQRASSSTIQQHRPHQYRVETNVTITVILPTELQIQILSYLTVDEQVSAGEVCSLWRSIIFHTGTLQAARYTAPGDTSLKFGLPATHGIFDCRKWFMCTARDRVIQRYRPLDPDHLLESEQGKIGRKQRLSSYRAFYSKHPAMEATDISNSPVLDEPFFSPFMPMPNAWRDVAAAVVALDKDAARARLSWGFRRSDGVEGAALEQGEDGMIAGSLTVKMVADDGLMGSGGGDDAERLGPWLPRGDITVREVVDAIVGMVCGGQHRVRLFGSEFEVRFGNSVEEKRSNWERLWTDRRWWPTAKFHYYLVYSQVYKKFISIQ
ncbi:hypothetical protein DRE_00377 [Drechslerella stenobrocha 248]|uniref:F-box domain-containing protein n=1 Tax=Drechslerella stenobrocha 248 TaxID=1043628 RepID=W7HV61_9PEZI|nr:hypothetical protein DRE_00377 [Drechslerella stenobrocha 248]